jgi:hypothetical protein
MSGMDSTLSQPGFAQRLDTKDAIMDRIRQEAAMLNARQLIDACLSLLLPSIFLLSANPRPRKSMSTASISVSQNPGLLCREARPPASLRAWRSTWRRGTR